MRREAIAQKGVQEARRMLGSSMRRSRNQIVVKTWWN
jgi:hypothetical protein